MVPQQLLCVSSIHPSRDDTSKPLGSCNMSLPQEWKIQATIRGPASSLRRALALVEGTSQVQARASNIVIALLSGPLCDETSALGASQASVSSS